jgi:uncharacterized protein (TIGR03435 family)
MFAQTDPARPAFEVVSVKPTPPERLNHLRYEKCTGGGPFVTEGTPLLWSIEFAYQLRDSDLAGWPAWLESFADAYEMEGRPAGRVTEQQCRQMVQSLLADRFHLKIHRETKERSVYLLLIGKNGSKLRVVKTDSPKTGGGVRINGPLMQSLSESEAPEGWDMPRLAGYLGDVPDVGRPVLDRTGLTGLYAFSLQFSRKDGDDRPIVFLALQEQLGLKLEAAKAPLDVVVIDHVERPSGN